MVIKVLVVDDSSFFRHRITAILQANAGFEVVGQASNGHDAIAMAKKFVPDAITMDYEMPGMDGISAVKAIMQERPIPILMFSSLTYDGARTTLNALEAGARDFLPKSFESVADNQSSASQILIERLRAITGQANQHFERYTPHSAAEQSTAQVNSGNHNTTEVGSPEPVSRVNQSQHHFDSKAGASTAIKPRQKTSLRPKLCVIGASTGGPVALQLMLSRMTTPPPFPVIIAQHMPATFTQAYADRLNTLCPAQVQHAQTGDQLMPGHVYVAPGGFQTIIKDRSLTLAVSAGDAKLAYRPSIDLTFASAAKILPSETLAIVLTGMGADGAQGAQLLHKQRSEVWIQNEASCVVFGMPRAVMQLGCYDVMASIDALAQQFAEVVMHGCT